LLSLFSPTKKNVSHHFSTPSNCITYMPNPIRTEPINSGLELNSIRVDICGIELTTTNEDACNERQDIDSQNLLLAGAARSDRAQAADGEAFDRSQFQTKASCNVQQGSKSQAGCCQMPNFNQRLPFLTWLWESNPGGGLLGFSSAPTSCWFELLNILASVLFTFPALACDLLIIICSAAFEFLLTLITCLHLFPQYVLSLRHGYARAQLRNTIKDNALLVFIAIMSLILMLSLALPWVNPKGHTGPTVIEGSCNNRTRCDVSASCNVVSPSSYTCSCPSWLVGSGFDDDPCICRSAVLSTPDFGRSICVTPLSHFTMPGLLGFIFGMTLFLIFALLGAAIGQIYVFFIWLILVLFASSGMLNPSIQPLCGVSSFDAQVCLNGQFCVGNACSRCAAPDLQSWDDISGKCINGVAGNCTAHSCVSLPGSTCIQKQNQFVHYHVCAKSVTSSSSVTAAPGVAALVFAVFMAMMT